MSITSMTFLFMFLPIALLLYYFFDSKVKEAVLLIISLFFYAIGSIEYIAIFSCAVFITVFLGRMIDGCREKSVVRKILFVCGIVLNVSLLVYYKYTDFFRGSLAFITSKEVQFKNIALPLGISFFTFKSISYLTDVYKRQTSLTDNPLHDALYLSFFAQIQSGPLSRHADISIQNKKKFDFELFSGGAYRFIVGFSKKIVIANVLSNITTEVFNTSFDAFSTSFAWLGSVCYSLQLFFDFSGYSDMAIGITEMFGYKCPENFNYPYTTESVSKFWRKWHITLGQWFRDYIYIPLGGSHNKNRWRVYFNLFVVWLLTGIWHGASWNFVAWGLGYFIVISFERLLDLPGRLRTKAGKILYRIGTLLFINFQWVLFNSKNIISGLQFIKRMIILYRNELTDRRTLLLLKDYGFFILVAVILSMPVIPWINDRLKDNGTYHRIFEVMTTVISLAAFIWAISFVVAGQNNPFVYANF